MPSAKRRPRLPRVAILGGGVAGMTAAFELSSAGWRERYESITVYQYGWRLGGKGASGRGDHGRIEEHGLHIWLGFYENAFRMMRECYEELGRDPSSPIATVDDAFEPASLFIVQEPRGDGWLPWFAEFSESGERPGADDRVPDSLWEIVLSGLRLTLSYDRSARATAADERPAPKLSLHPEPVPVGAEARGLSLQPSAGPTVEALATRVRGLYRRLAHMISDVRQFELAAALTLAEQLPHDPTEHDPEDHHLLRGLVERALERLRERRERPDNETDQTRRDWYLTEIILTTIRGLIADGVLVHPDGLDAIDDYDFSEWLIRHGAAPESARCGLVTTLMYDLPFAYRAGDPKQPAIGAGTALRGALRTLFTYRGAIAWKMRAGMGDIVFAPMFEVLERRGVRFEFFHRVESLHPSKDGSRVESIELTRQATLRNPKAGYRPLQDVKDLPCWPNAPISDQLVKPLSVDDAESFWSTARGEGRVTLRDGTDFDQVVLAIPVGAHPYICGELIKRRPRWQEMVEQVATIYTQAFQVWLSADMHELGCDWPQATTGGYLEPFDTYADMRQLIERECWPDGKIGAIAYFCSVMPTPPGCASRADRELPQRAADQVKANSIAFLRDAIGPLWPRGVRRYPTEFRWELLFDDQDRSGAERFDSQFWRVNVDPSERYVQSLPGTARYRLGAEQSGFDNLVFAGDWTRCGLNSGCVEAAVISGMLAAAAVDPTVQRRPIGWRAEGGGLVF